MTPGCSVKHPWKVIVKEKLPKELFDMVEATVSRTSLGEISMKTQCKQIVCLPLLHRKKSENCFLI